MANQRCTVYYTGRVQGVGFRWTTMRQLSGLPLTGFVRNLIDGRVELTIEGGVEVIEEGLSRVRQALAANVDREAIERGPATDEFDNLEIRR